MSNDIQKANQIAYRFYTKLALVVNYARATVEPPHQAKVDKWFNLETPDSDLFKEQLRIYRSVSEYPHPQPLEIQVLLSIPELTSNQVLVYLGPDSSRLRIEPTPRHILLESWFLAFNSVPQIRTDGERGEVAPSTMYKHGIPLFRSLYTLLRILPSWKLFKKLRRRTTGSYRNGNLSIQLRLKGSSDGSEDILDFDTPPALNSLPLPNETHVFPPIPHPMGNLTLSTKYLSNPNFQLDELESLLSSRFLSLDEGPEFTPTLIKNQQRDSLSVLPGSLPIRTSLPKSPPSSIADKFVLPVGHSRTDSLIGGQSPRNIALPMSRTSNAGAGASSNSLLSVASSFSATWSKDDGRPLSGIAARVRKESTGTGRGADLPSTPSPLPIRRPNINPIHPFKSSTLSSGSPSLHSPSPSMRQPSPLCAGITSLPSRPNQTSPTSSRVPPSPIGIGSRPSPPFAPSSLGDRRSLASAEGDELSPRFPSRKRYSSSFGHRYGASGGAGSEGSGGSVERREGDRVGVTSFLGPSTDDDEISIFVQDIDSRKPLQGIHRSKGEYDRHGTLTHAEDVGESSSSVKVSEESPTGPMLTKEADVDERLRHMNEIFFASLEGLGRRRTDSDSSSRASAAGSGGIEERSSEIPTSRPQISRDTRVFPATRPRLTSLRSMNTTDATSSSTGSAEVMGRMDLDDDVRRGTRAS